MQEKGQKLSVILKEYVHSTLFDTSGEYTVHMVHAIIAPKLCSAVIFGLPFLTHHNIVVDHTECSAIDKPFGFDFLNPFVQRAPCMPKKKLKRGHCKLKGFIY